MLTTLFRIVKYGLQGFWRNGWLSTATVIIMALALLMFQGLLLFETLTTAAVNSIQDKIDVAVYFKKDATETQMLAIRDKLEADFSQVKSVRYISKEEALEVFKSRHQEEAIINQALEELNDNPLLPSLSIKTNDPNDYPILEEFLSNSDNSVVIEKISSQTQANRDAIDRLNRIISTVNKLGLVFTLFIALVACLVAFNTIRLAIYSNREEIGIMKLVGASNVFAKGPYIVGGILYGIVGAVAALVLAAPLVNISSPVFKRLIPDMNLEVYFYNNLRVLFFYLLAAGIGLGIVSSWIAIRRYLKI
ncbi:MAG: hypothetical protein COU10_00625 [Candidatus Harrisonbacteria bacterium CG10_big_fil_rev_8_21_14_0_10_45_28]|uniref:Cell division protein FtsX n=1 Tax=Candidatus Harrisonbacteria bacterium CG10_big_fil_rev_8_21_14_0_10_45_28 TaxID=1974586 RepID=A0A2H0UR73_9BACT|nr:MAG: hypothetical protein COU10_00625 [Candidatus Harrisonbacteria bacterium CG10_big_fil_rev_8_21_14_0_10_45_28]